MLFVVDFQLVLFFLWHSAQEILKAFKNKIDSHHVNTESGF